MYVTVYSGRPWRQSLRILDIVRRLTKPKRPRMTEEPSDVPELTQNDDACSDVEPLKLHVSCPDFRNWRSQRLAKWLNESSGVEAVHVDKIPSNMWAFV